MKTITLWRVPTNRAKKIVDLMIEEAREALEKKNFRLVEEIMYEVQQIENDISDAKDTL